MTVAERLSDWNNWYDKLPREWRFQFVLWPILALAAINFALTISIRFQFALLPLLGIIFVTAVRVPYVLGWISAAEGLPEHEAGNASFQIEGVDRLVDLNRRLDALSAPGRIWVFTAILLIAGAINMLLTIHHAFPFGLLFLLTLLALVVIRAPHAAGWLKSPRYRSVPVPSVQFDPKIEDAAPPAISEEQTPLEPPVPGISATGGLPLDAPTFSTSETAPQGGDREAPDSPPHIDRCPSDHGQQHDAPRSGIDPTHSGTADR